jgi:hypothetical protein
MPIPAPSASVVAVFPTRTRWSFMRPVSMIRHELIGELAHHQHPHQEFEFGGPSNMISPPVSMGQRLGRVTPTSRGPESNPT